MRCLVERGSVPASGAASWRCSIVSWSSLVAAIFLTVAACSDGLPGASARQIPPFDGADSRRDLAWGIYQIYWGRARYGDRLDRSLTSMATTPDYVMFYRDLGRGFPRSACDVLRTRGAVPIVSLELWRWGDPGNYLTDVATGGHDGFFRAWARDARDFGSPVFLRFGFEMNGDWFGWGGRPEEFITSWRHVHAIFEEEGADNVTWVWSPNAVSIPREAWNRIDAYYPGDDVVDWVALDGYNFGDAHSEWHRWESFEDIFGPGLDLFAGAFPGRPVMIAEFGCAPGEPGQRAAWIRDAYRYVTRRKEIRTVVWFNLDKRREGEPNWNLDSESDASAAFNETFARPRS